MTDVHAHVSGGDAQVREWLVGRAFRGVHPWAALADGASAYARWLGERAALEAGDGWGVGEIGLDRLKVRDVSPAMRRLFEEQLDFALAHRLPVALHGAKCWGQVVAAVRARAAALGLAESALPPMLYHGFSRSDGLVPDIVRLGGYISVGPAVLNAHAVNYRALARRLPSDRLLVETDRTAENAGECPSVGAVLAALAELRGVSVAELERQTDGNAEAFRGRTR